MKKIISMVLIICFSCLLFACGSSKAIDGKVYETYGLINREEVKDSKIKYRIIKGNFIWGIILMETIIAPVYFFGFSLWEPVEKAKGESL